MGKVNGKILRVYIEKEDGTKEEVGTCKDIEPCSEFDLLSDNFVLDELEKAVELENYERAAVIRDHCIKKGIEMN